MVHAGAPSWQCVVPSDALILYFLNFQFNQNFQNIGKIQDIREIPERPEKKTTCLFFATWRLAKIRVAACRTWELAHGIGVYEHQAGRDDADGFRWDVA